MTRLTDSAVRSLKANKAARREILDDTGAGLRLLIHPSGKKSFVMRFRRPSGEACKLTLGAVDLSGAETKDAPVLGAPLTLRSARELANKIQRQRKSGIDVVAVHQSAKVREKVVAKNRKSNAFDALARNFFDEYLTRHNEKPRGWRADARLLGIEFPEEGEPSLIAGGLASRWKGRHVAEIGAAELLGTIDEARKRGVPGMGKRTKGNSEGRARAMRSILSVFFKWLLDQLIIPTNPVSGLKRSPTPKARERYLDDVEIKILWRATEEIGPPFGSFIKLLLLTGCRRDEAAELPWSELSQDRSFWMLSGARAKNHRKHRWELPPAARAVIKSVKKVSADYVFSTNGRGPIRGFSKIKVALDAAMIKIAREEDAELKIQPWVLHDLRRTVGTRMNEIGIPPHIVSAVLSHRDFKSGVHGTYNLADYMPEREAALQRWANHIDNLVAGESASKVVPMRKTARGKR